MLLSCGKVINLRLVSFVQMMHWQDAGISEEVAKEGIYSEELPTSRQRKMPIVLRVKNGLKNGWLMQNWKRGAAKQKRRSDEKDSLSLEGEVPDRKEREDCTPSLVDKLVPHSLGKSYPLEKEDFYPSILESVPMNNKIIEDPFAGSMKPIQVSPATDGNKVVSLLDEDESKGGVYTQSHQSQFEGLAETGFPPNYTLWGGMADSGLLFGNFDQLNVSKERSIPAAHTNPEIQSGFHHGKTSKSNYLAPKQLKPVLEQPTTSCCTSTSEFKAQRDACVEDKIFQEESVSNSHQEIRDMMFLNTSASHGAGLKSSSLPHQATAW